VNVGIVTTQPDSHHGTPVEKHWVSALIFHFSYINSISMQSKI